MANDMVVIAILNNAFNHGPYFELYLSNYCQDFDKYLAHYFNIFQAAN